MRFTTFELDEANARLTCDGRPVALAPKAFAVLCELARQPGRLVSKGDLLDAAWGHRHVSESVLKTTVSELRAAMGDDPKQPRYIETAQRRGYRFIGVAERADHRVAPSSDIASASAVAGSAQPDGIVVDLPGRRVALARLNAAWSLVAHGGRRLVWIAGEAGIGKTTLVDRLIADLAPACTARGQCVEQFGAGEPYLPVLEALALLCRADPGLQPLMRAVAPAWLMQMPWLLATEDRAILQRELAGAHPDRMLRELSELFDRYTAGRPLLLVTEDLHWSDHATVRLIDHFARSRGPAQVMWVATFRPAEAIMAAHALAGVRHELRARGLCDEIALDPFSEREVADYIAARFTGSNVADPFARSLHAHTEGLPLFVVNVVDDLVSQGAILLTAGATFPQTVSEVPQSVAGMIERRWARLPESQQAVLEAASVAGVEFRCETLALALQRDPAAVASCCEALAREEHWLRQLDVRPLTDGSLDTRYAFGHALYRHVLYQRGSAHARASLHRRIGRALEASLAAPQRAPAAELAFHFELGREPLLALRHFVAAVESALARFAPTEALSLIDRALPLLPSCPASDERLDLELVLMTRRGVTCSLLEGIGSAGARQAFERAQALCESLPVAPQRAWILSGLGWVAYSRGDYASSLALAKSIQAISARFDDPAILACAADLTGLTLVNQGELRESLDWLQRGIRACDAASDRLPSTHLRVIDPGVSMRSIISIPLAQLGLVEQAQSHVDAAIARARDLAQPVAEMLAYWCAASLHARLERVDEVLCYADLLTRLASEQRLAPAEGPGLWFAGWARARQGDPETGHALILRGYAAHERLGRQAGGTHALTYAAEAMVLAEHWPEAQQLVDSGLQLAERLGERLYVPDLLLQQGRIAAGTERADLARASRLESLRLARAQHALWLELAALNDLCEGEDGGAAHAVDLAATYARIEEGHQTPLVARVRARLGR